MKSVFNFLLVFLISISLKAQQLNNGANYRMKQIAIQTRWAKEAGPNNVLKEYPRPQLERKGWISLNGLWNYAITGAKVDKILQYDGKILVPFPLESALSGVKRPLQPDQALWYHRAFNRPVLKAGEKLLLNFGAVSWEAFVYVNGKMAGKHTGAYTSFSLDITGLLKAGKNDIEVKVWNPLEKGIGPRGKQTLEPNSMWYTASSGIWQTVWLEKVPEHYIKSIKVTPDVDKGLLNLVVNASSVIPAKTGISVKVPGCSECRILKQVQDDDHTNITLKVPNAKLWSPDDPFLYDLEVTLGKDKVKSYFGMRKVEIKKDEKGIDRIFLNNKYTYNLAVLDQGFWPDGLYTAPTDEALKFDIEAANAMGFNTIRKHIKVEPARWYYHADKLGVLVWQDFVQPGVKFGKPVSEESKKEFEKESAEMMTQLHHFPSITTWVLFNEGWGVYDQERLTQWVKETDPTRLVNGHSGSAIVNGKLEKRHIAEVTNKSINSDMTDVHSYPPPAIPNYIPGKAMVLGEFGGIGVSVEGHLWDDLQSVYSYGKMVSCGEMRRIYSTMTDSLIKLEKIGLSASIYTQPYDVEGEQNGLMTYDREKTKIPFEVMRAINGKLWPVVSSKKNLRIGPADTSDIDFDKQIALYQQGKRDSVFLRSLTLLASAKRNADWTRSLSEAYFTQIKNPFSENNLKFLKRFTRNTTDIGFSIFLNNVDRVNKVLGEYAAEDCIAAAIEKSEIAPNTKDGNPNWKEIEERVTSKYGEIGTSIVWLSKVVFSVNNKQWQLFESSLVPWYSRFGVQRSRTNTGLINSLAWKAFEQIEDSKILNAVSEMTANALEYSPDDDLLIDTHANILHKLGRTKEAIAWEQKAIALDPGKEEYQQVLKKLKAGTATWTKP
ncbi:sugar-binding domain-containing protein [Pedobacter deserti]|uniref:sugar-binding domain-containing protein n=1 Tax=Pedobacter deserti TaxID=2817382 RepID=UPI00210A0C55|nr:sugar-binding domain-containing protein [Pedobacter sp. SYSU D00382]